MRDNFGVFNIIGFSGQWWSSTTYSASNAWYRTVISTDPVVYRTNVSVNRGVSIRCLQDPPTAPTVDTDAATSVLAMTATLEATLLNAGSTVVSATGFKYGTDAALSSPTDVAGSGISSPFTANLTCLTASTQYWAVGYATNSVGTSYGDTITFTTGAATPSNTPCAIPSVTYDGYTYPTVQIGGQCWFAENLRTDNYRDGSAIPGNLDNTAWAASTSGALTVLDQGGPNEATNLTTFGQMYNGYAVNDARGLCPTGWHVPTDAEWTVLETQLGGSACAGFEMKSMAPAWDGNSPTGGFSALVGGIRNNNQGLFFGTGFYSGWWTSTSSGTDAYARYLTSAQSSVARYNLNVRYGLYVRCIQDPPTSPTVDTDAATSVTETTATLSATITATGGAAVSATGFKYGTDAGLTTPTDIAGSGTTSPFTASLTGLTGATQYWAVGYATNSVGTSYGDTITFTTNAAAVFTCGTSTVTYDGYAYATVLIGTQCWFQENLQTDQYRDGSSIPGQLTDADWSLSTTGTQAVWEEGTANEAANLAAQGRMYNGYAVLDARGLCPTGWHVPTSAEWTSLTTYLGANAGTQMKSFYGWNGTNPNGFNAIPVVWRGTAGVFNNSGAEAYFWTSTAVTGTTSARRYLTTPSVDLTADNSSNKRGMSVRCLKD
jgi:uncharacterized protein (TIGR02145 family)